MIPVYNTRDLIRHPTKRSYSVEASQLQRLAAGPFHHNGVFILRSHVTGRECRMIVAAPTINSDNEITEWKAIPVVGEIDRLSIKPFTVTIWND